ncbi:DUF4329 domain-containing protein [Endozoicomonas ascidiicola]|uniref:DUF4329 domain-containing protein n=1 Tax=Endozoicomonas ascidiicola TaxID=1698521 RepID=UPI00082AD2D6|nr:DUF4329 domain-containing protein [Endozoicomonas ascidiicola]
MRRKLSFLALGAALISPSFSNDIKTFLPPPIINLSEFYQSPFETELAAVIAATSIYNPTSIKDDREYIGGIFKHEDKDLYYFSAIPGVPGKNQISATLQFPDHLKLISVWHTHGAGKGGFLFFSRQDKRLVESLNVPLYLADSSGFLKKLSPGDPTLTRGQAYKKGLGYTKGYSKGSKVIDEKRKFIKIPTAQATP